MSVVDFLTNSMNNITRAGVVGATPGGSAVGSGAGQGIGAGAILGGARGTVVGTGPGGATSIGGFMALTTGQPAQGQDMDLYKTILQNFDTIDKDGNGFLTNDELSGAKQNELKDFGDLVDQKAVGNNQAFKFLNIDPTMPAWTGMSKNDVALVVERMNQGVGLNQIEQAAKNLGGSQTLGPQI